MSRKYLIACIISIIFIFVAGAVLYWGVYLPQHQQKMAEEYVQQITTARESFYSGNATSSITAVTAQLKKAPTKAQEGSLTLLLASSLLARHQPGDVQKSLQMFAEVAANTSFLPVQRALALNSIALLISSEKITPTQYQSALNTTQFATYVPIAGNDTARIQEAYLHVLTLSDQIYPTSFAEYAIAGNYYVPQLRNAETATSSQIEIATLIQKYVTMGDSRNDMTIYTPLSPTPAIASQYRALAINASSQVLKNKTITEREAAYKLSLQTAEQTQIQKNNVAYPLVLQSRFFYAGFLRTELYPDRKSDILTLLNPFAQVDVSNIGATYFKALAARQDSDSIKSVAVQLAAVSPEFKGFLLSVGFTKL